MAAKAPPAPAGVESAHYAERPVLTPDLARPNDKQLSPTLRHGQGRVVVENVRGQSVVVRDASTSPLRLLCPDHSGPAAWVYASSFGGGMVAGDRIDITVQVGADAAGVLTTQAANKVYHQRDGLGCVQTLHAEVESGALLVLGPDPITCFTDAVYEQHQQIDLERGASLVLVDWMTSGRAAMGERWAFHRYASRNDIRLEGDLIVRDALRLDAELEDPGADMVTGGYHCFANVFLIGPIASELDAALKDTLERTPPEKKPDLLLALSPVEAGHVLRFAGRTTQLVAEALREALAFLEPRLGRGLWDRKW